MRLSPLLAAAFLVAGSLAAHADSIGSGTYTGTLLATTSSTISGTGKTVSFTESVYQESGTGYLEFVLQADNSGYDYYLDSVSNTSFSGYTTSFAYDNDGNSKNVAPTSVSENNNGKVTFNFSDVSDADTDSLIIYTDATNFTAGTVAVGNGPNSDPPGFEPTTGVYSPAPTPEPSSLVLLGTGLIGVAGAVRRRLA